MGEKRFGISARLALSAFLAAFAFIACAAPRVVILKDPLSAQEHVDLGLSYEVQGRLDLAEREYEQAITKERTWAIPYFNLGNIAYRGKDLSAAERYYARALELDRTNPDIMNNLALVLHELGDDAQAAMLMEQALEIRCRDEYLDTLRIIGRDPKSPCTPKGLGDQ